MVDITSDVNMIYEMVIYVSEVVSFVIVGLFDMSVIPKSASSYRLYHNFKTYIASDDVCYDFKMSVMFIVMLVTDISDKKC